MDAHSEHKMKFTFRSPDGQREYLLIEGEGLYLDGRRLSMKATALKVLALLIRASDRTGEPRRLSNRAITEAIHGRGWTGDDGQFAAEYIRQIRAAMNTADRDAVKNDRSLGYFFGWSNISRESSSPARFPTSRPYPVHWISEQPHVTHYRPRHDAISSLREAIVEDANQTTRPVAILALQGMGGVGKTVLARALVDDDRVRARFTDGIVWLSVGRESAMTGSLLARAVAKRLGADEHTTHRSILQSRAALIVVDDVWNYSDLEPLLFTQGNSRLLFTTRDHAIARASGAFAHNIAPMTDLEARNLLADWTRRRPETMPASSERILRHIGNLPGAIAVIGGVLHNAEDTVWDAILAEFDTSDVRALESLLPSGQPSFYRAVEISLGQLHCDIQQKYLQLAVLLEDYPVPFPVLQTLWNASLAEVRLIAKLLQDRSLVEIDREERLRLHDIQLDFVRSRYVDPETLATIHAAFKLSAHVISLDSTQFAPQLAGRLLPHAGMPAIRHFIESLYVGNSNNPLQPLWPALDFAGGALVQTLTGHEARVNAVAVTSDGRKIISGSSDHTLRIWEFRTGNEFGILQGHSDSVNAVALNSEGLVVSGSDDGSVRIWDLETRTEVARLSTDARSIKAVALLPSGEIIAGTNDASVRFWKRRTLGEEYIHHPRFYDRQSNNASPIRSLIVNTDDGNVLVVGEKECPVLFNPQSRAEVVLSNRRFIKALVLTPDNRTVVTVREAHVDYDEVELFDLETELEQMADLPHKPSASFSPSRRKFGFSAAPQYGLGRPANDGPVRSCPSNAPKIGFLPRAAAAAPKSRSLSSTSFRTAAANISAVAVSPTGREIAAACSDGSITIWSMTSQKELHILRGHTEEVAAICFTPDGSHLISGSQDSTVKLWSIAAPPTGKVGRVVHGTRIKGLTVLCGMDRVVSLSNDNVLRIWGIESGDEIASLALPGSITTALAITSEADRALVASGNEVVVLSFDRMQELFTYRRHHGIVSCVSVSPDSKFAASASQSKMGFAKPQIKVWELNSGRDICVLEGHANSIHSVVMLPDSKKLISASADQTLKLWDAATGAVLHTFTGHTGALLAAKLMRNGRSAVSVSSDGTACIWDLESYNQISRLRGHAGPVNDVAISPDESAT
jgi:WD40 repeat protein